MRVASLGFHVRFARAAVIVACAVGLPALQRSTGLTNTAWARATPGAAGTIARRLVLSDQARRYLALQFRSYPTEFMGCMIGRVHASTVVVARIAPADVDPAQSARTHVVPQQSCEQAGWSGTVGMIHSHPSGEACWYSFPGTSVLASDGQSFVRQPYPVDAIMCGDRVVWISRDLAERQLSPVTGGDGTAATTLAR